MPPSLNSPKLFMALATPSSAALRYQLAAAGKFGSTPRPYLYRLARLFDTKRYEQSIALANQIRQKATEVSKHVSEWALQTRNAGLEIRNVFERLNGGVHLSQE